MGWKLQWAPTTMETAREAEQYEFYRVDEDLVLIYDKKPNELFSMADDRFLSTMKANELEWLKSCIEQTAAKTARKNPEKAFLNDKAFMQAFEKELAKEKEKMERKEDAGDGDGAEA